MNSLDTVNQTYNTMKSCKPLYTQAERTAKELEFYNEWKTQNNTLYTALVSAIEQAHEAFITYPSYTTIDTTHELNHTLRRLVWSYVDSKWQAYVAMLEESRNGSDTGMPEMMSEARGW